MPANPAFTLAEHVCQTTFAALPASAVRATKRDILDTLGAALGAAWPQPHSQRGTGSSPSHRWTRHRSSPSSLGVLLPAYSGHGPGGVGVPLSYWASQVTIVSR